MTAIKILAASTQEAEYTARAIFTVGGILTGIIATNTANWFIRRRSERKKFTVLLFDEFNSVEMLKHRLSADETLKNKDYKNLQHLYNSISMDEYLHVSQVLHFFEKIQAYDDSNLVNGKLMKGLMGSYFRYWNQQFYRKIAKDINLDDSISFNTGMISSVMELDRRFGRT